MASSSSNSLLFFIFLIIVCFFSSHQTLARDSQFFFSKATRPNTPRETPPLKEKKEEPSPAATHPVPQTQNVYGRHFSPTTSTATPYYNYENNNFYGNSGTQYNPDGYNKNNARSFYNHGNIPENEVAGGSYKNSMEYQNSDQYGMSDTRMMENGNYFYDVNDGATNNPKEYHGSFRGVEGSGGNYAYNGDHSNNRGSGYGNFMEGYQNQVSQEEYVP